MHQHERSKKKEEIGRKREREKGEVKEGVMIDASYIRLSSSKGMYPASKTVQGA
jgi:hypothetical protein